MQYSVPFLLAFGLTPGKVRLVLWLALGLSVIGNFGVITLPISGIELEQVEVAGQTMYAFQLAVDYKTGAYPILLGLGYVGGALYLIAYAYLAWRTWKEVRVGRPGEGD
ncbi:MAG: hypothetical protein ACP5HM_08800 [Anaerolineae bacterium]